MNDLGMKVTVPLIKVSQAFLLHKDNSLSGVEVAELTRLASGTLYPLLRRLEEANWLSSEWEQVEPTIVARPRRRLYKLTGVGAIKTKQVLRDSQVQPRTVEAWVT